MTKRGPLYVLACYIMWGVLPIFWKLLDAVDSFYILASRILWSLVLSVVVLAVQRRLGAVAAVARDRRELKRLVLASAMVFLNWGGFIWAVNSGRVLDSSLAYYMYPIISILLGTLVYREKLVKLQWLAVVVMFAGIAAAALRNGEIPWLALMIGFSFASYGAVKKSVRSDSMVSMFYETLIPAPLMLALLVWMECRGSGAIGVLSGWQWLLLPLSGVVTTIPLLFFAIGVRNTSMSLSGLLMYINPTIQLLLSVALYGEDFTTTHAILFGFVWMGLVLYLYSSRRREKTH